MPLHSTLYHVHIVSLNSIMFSYVITHMCVYPHVLILIYLAHTSRLNYEHWRPWSSVSTVGFELS